MNMTFWNYRQLGILSFVVHFLLIMIVMYGSLSAEIIKQEYHFPQPDIKETRIDGIDYHRIIIENCDNSSDPGQPSLPSAGAKILIPFGAEITSVDIKTPQRVHMGSHYYLLPASEPQMISMKNTETYPAPDISIYESDQPFPGASCQQVTIQNFRGYRILVLKLNPVEYIPSSGDLYFYPDIEITVSTEYGKSSHTLYRGLAKDESEALSKVDNPGQLTSYETAQKRDGDDFDLLILTDPSFVDAFQPLKDYHNQSGMPTEIRTTAEVGSLVPEDIRDYVRQIYLDHGISYLLIGGDHDIIPARLMFASAGGSYSNNNVAADMYFGCLDGGYNFDGDTLWGELMDGDDGAMVDAVAEVYVGRAPVGTVGETHRFVKKTLDYITCHQSYLKNILLVGQDLGYPGIAQYGGFCMEEYVDISDANDYTTYAFPTSIYDIDKLYEMDYDWEQQELLDRIYDGRQAINHLGHGFICGTMKIDCGDALEMSNTRRVFIYSQACQVGDFDIPEGDCLAEHLTVKSDGGAFAVIMNNWAGFCSSYDGNGTSQVFNRHYWDAVFNPDKNIMELGRANQCSKEDILYLFGHSTSRACFYQLNFLGDPTIRFKKEWLDNPSISFLDNLGDGDGTLEAGETIDIEVELHNSLSDTLRGLTVTLWCEDGTLPIINGSCLLGDVPPGSDADNHDSPMQFSIPVDYTPRMDSFTVTLECSDGFKSAYDIHQAIGKVTVLVVDDDDGGNYESYFTECLSRLLIPYHTWDCSAKGTPDSNFMNNYDIVIWFTATYRTGLMEGADVPVIKSYLDNGGKLFLTGQTIAQYLHAVDDDFLQNYLKADYVDKGMIPKLTSEPDGQVFGPGDTVIIIGENGADNQFLPDFVNPINGGVAEFSYYNSDFFGGISYSGDYRLVFFTFGFEAIDDWDGRLASRDAIMTKIMDFFEQKTPNRYPSVTAIQIIDNDSMHILDTYPQFSWTYEDPEGQEQSMYHIRVGDDPYFEAGEMWEFGPVAGPETSIMYGGMPFMDGQTCYIKVRVFDGIFWSDWTVVEVHANTPPPCPVEFNPCGLQVVVEEMPILEVGNVIDAENDDNTYDFEVYGDAQLTTLLTQINNIPQTPVATGWQIDIPLDEDSIYYWRARASDPYESGQWGQPASFWVNAQNLDPQPFTLISPANDARLPDCMPAFTWALPDDPDRFDSISSYTLVYSKYPDFSGYSVSIEGLDSTAYEMCTLLDYNVTYYWKVMACDKFGGGGCCESVYSFTTIWRGDVNNDGLINVGDVLVLINYIFKDGPVPDPQDCGNVNCDVGISVGDAVYLINYIFKGGPEPCT